MVLLKNGTIYQNNKFITDDILVENGLIKAIGNINTNAQTIDLKGAKIIPGLIDIHIHGSVGIDVMDANPEGLNKIARFLAEKGTTSFLATTITSNHENLIKALESINEANNKNVVGVHIEGPYINKDKRGCHDPMFIRNPNINEYDNVKEVFQGLIHYTIAPELAGAIDFIEKITNDGTTVSIGHSNANMEITKLGLNAGANIFTHLFNAMSPIHHRDPNVSGTALLSDAFTELICDGIHVNKEIIKLIYKLKGRDKIILVTDAMQACGLGDGSYHFGGFDITVKDGVARKDDGTLASSTLTMFEALQNMMEFANLTLEEAIDMATINPAKAIKIDKEYGSIDIGKHADLLILDENENIKAVINKGEFI